MKLKELIIKESKEKFEANMLDGDKVNDCGGAMLSVEYVFEYFSDFLSETIDKVEKETKDLWYAKGYEDGLFMKRQMENPRLTKECPKCGKKMEVIEKTKYSAIFGCPCTPNLRLSIG